MPGQVVNRRGRYGDTTVIEEKIGEPNFANTTPAHELTKTRYRMRRIWFFEGRYLFGG